jgi:hypothetical protein
MSFSAHIFYRDCFYTSVSRGCSVGIEIDFKMEGPVRFPARKDFSNLIASRLAVRPTHLPVG